MNFCVYILYSESLQKFYVGETEDMNLRLQQHIKGFFKDSFTAKADDWTLFHMIKCDSKRQSINIERHIKRMKSSVYIKNLKKFADIERNLKTKYS